MKSIAAILLLNFIVMACIEPFEPEVQNFESVLVVEGQISDEDKPSEIYLSRSRALNSEESIPEKSATVTLSGDEGETYHFAEVDAGIYESPDTFRGGIGKSYTLNIETNDGDTYRSHPLIIKKCPPIDSVYFEEEARITDEGEVLSGIVILVDTHDPASASRNYRWEWEESWEVRVPYPSTYVWQDDTSTLNTPTCGWPIPRDHKISLCYNSDFSKSNLIERTANLSQDRVSQFELAYISTIGYRLNSLYSINVRQQVMDDKEYEYWSELKKLSETLGTVFDPQPYYIQGNLYNVNEPNEPVLGYVGASSVAEKRIFITREHTRDLEFPYNGCIDELVAVNYCLVDLYFGQGYLIAALPDYHPANEYVFMAPARCSDSREDGSIEKPEFWPY